jgi:hypothetical protein
MSSYQALDAAKIVETLQRLEGRITRRFPIAHLGAVCRALIAIGERTHGNAAAIAAPNWPLRIVIYVAVAAGLSALAYLALRLDLNIGHAEVFSFLEGVDAVMHITVAVAAAFLFATSADDRIKRRRALRELHVFRSIAHVIDMHQLTKDPGSLLGDDQAPGATPRRRMTPSELTRYLDYCSEMLSLTSKLAALYAQVLPDAVVIDAVNEIENLTANFSRKIWQKISIVESLAAPTPAASTR